MIMWPAQLPREPLHNIFVKYEKEMFAANSDTDSSKKIFHKYIPGPSSFKVAMDMSALEADALVTFYNNVLDYGTKPFSWQDESMARTASYRFVGVPTLKSNKEGSLHVTIDLEVID